METLTKGYNRKCKDGVGGVQYIALYPFVPYHRFQIITDGETLVSHPTTEIFRFYPVGDISSNENQSEDAGGKFYDQTINFKLQTIYLLCALSTFSTISRTQPEPPGKGEI